MITRNPRRSVDRVRPMLATILAVIAAVAVFAGAGSVACAEELTVADHVVVRKAERKLYLYRGNELLGAYRIALGLNPVGHKERENDFRTPEGHYMLAQRNTRSSYFLSILVSYPNPDDQRRAQKRGWLAGGAIMIHGFPNAPTHSAAYYATTDWTNGCIALSNSDMVEVWMRTPDNTPIDILP
jgi:murein L,D-transpeptidase YafK